MSIRLKGIEKVMKKIKTEGKDKVEKLSMAGMIKVAILIRRDMEKTTPITPVDTSNLRHSWFTVTSTGETQSEPKFTGKDSSQMSSDHSEAVSEFEGKAKGNNKPNLIMGFSARYAAAVHEGIGKSGAQMKFKRPGSGAKFFESAIQRNQPRIKEIIDEELKKL